MASAPRRHQRRIIMIRWQQRTLERPDRYLDWEKLNRPYFGRSPRNEPWCSALIQVFRGSSVATALENPKKLADAIDNETVHYGTIFRMHHDERTHLEKMKDEIRGLPSLDEEDVRLQFFIYLAEEGAYEDGAYTNGEYFRFRFVGPPIPNLSFNKKLDPRDRLSFCLRGSRRHRHHRRRNSLRQRAFSHWERWGPNRRPA